MVTKLETASLTDDWSTPDRLDVVKVSVTFTIPRFGRAVLKLRVGVEDGIGSLFDEPSVASRASLDRKRELEFNRDFLVEQLEQLLEETFPEMEFYSACGRCGDEEDASPACTSVSTCDDPVRPDIHIFDYMHCERESDCFNIVLSLN